MTGDEFMSFLSSFYSAVTNMYHTGAHTIGKMTKKNSAFVGQWTQDNDVFNNQYFKNLKDSSLGYHQEKNAAGQ